MIDPANPALRAFVARDLSALAGLGGLPAELSLGEVTAELGANPEVTVRWLLGDPAEEAFWCPVNGLDGFGGRIKIWFRGATVVKLDGERPAITPDDVQTLGAPELEIDHRMDVLVIRNGEKVWASKGIAVKLNRALTRVVGLSTFPATSPEAYLADLQEFDEYREES